MEAMPAEVRLPGEWGPPAPAVSAAEAMPAEVRLPGEWGPRGPPVSAAEAALAGVQLPEEAGPSGPAVSVAARQDPQPWAPAWRVGEARGPPAPGSRGGVAPRGPVGWPREVEGLLSLVQAEGERSSEERAPRSRAGNVPAPPARRLSAVPEHPSAVQGAGPPGTETAPWPRPERVEQRVGRGSQELAALSSAEAPGWVEAGPARVPPRRTPGRHLRLPRGRRIDALPRLANGRWSASGPWRDPAPAPPSSVRQECRTYYQPLVRALRATRWGYRVHGRRGQAARVSPRRRVRREPGTGSAETPWSAVSILRRSVRKARR